MQWNFKHSRQLLRSLCIVFLCFGASTSVFADFLVPASPGTYVLDEAEILSDETEATLEAQLSTLDVETSTQMVVVTLSDLQGYEPEQAALEIGRSWGVGQKGLDNGLVFLIAPNDRAVRIEVGYGLEGAITDAQSYSILNQLALPSFADGDYDQGTVDAMLALEALARGETFATMPVDSSSGTFDINNYLVLNHPESFIVFAILFWILLRKASKSKPVWLDTLFGGIIGMLASDRPDWLFGLISGTLITGLISAGMREKGWIMKLIRWLIKNTPKGGGGFGGGFGGGGSSHGGGSSGGSGGGFSGGGGSFGGGGATGRW